MDFSIQETFPIYSVFILILIIAVGQLPTLFPCRLQYAINTNTYLKHVIGYMAMVFFVIITIPIKSKQIFDIMQLSLPLYAFFIVLIKTEIYFFISILLLIFISYILILRKTEINDEIKSMQSIDTKTTNASVIHLQSNIDLIEKINNGIFSLVLPLLITGFVIYFGKKRLQYKNDFDFIKFIFGTTSCHSIRNEMKQDNIPFSTAIAYAFK